jgi:DNA-binding NarL/FixJ family response regulator
MALVYDKDDLVHITHEVAKLAHPFLHPRGLAFFQFKRVYKDAPAVTLANRPDFFRDILEGEFVDPSPYIPFYIRQSSICFWDESLPEERLATLRENRGENRGENQEESRGIYHGLTIISRRKDFYDCTTFAISQRHPTPFAYYYHILKDLQKFAEVFPAIARGLIQKSRKQPVKTLPSRHGVSRKNFFLPKRSSRFHMGKGENDYITTYEALCAQLLQEGKSYKEIGSILSMAPSTVETHLKRFKARTGLTVQELSLQPFQGSKGEVS